MKTKKLFLSVVLFLVCGNLFSQISSGKKEYQFNNAPILVIEKITFADENNNQIADAGENCYLKVKIKNTGKSAAKSVNMQINTNPPSQSWLSFEKSFPIGNIQIGEIKEAKIPIHVGTSFENLEISFELVAREANNFDSNLASLTVSVKAAEALVAVNWHYPEMTETSVNEGNCTLKACIISSINIDKVELFVNNKPYRPDRGFKLQKTEKCDYYFEQVITLERGSNMIQLKANNKTKKADSEIRNIIYNDINFEYRTALVIGNGNYEDAPLKNPVNDASAMAKTLRKLNFDVIEVLDGDLSTIRQGVREFHSKLDENKGVGLFYYAGHGVQSKGENYLIPVKHDIKQEFEIPDRAIRANSVLEAMESTNTRMNIVILDACRNNPFIRSFRSGNRGLAQISSDGTGSIIAYSTAPGSVASDGEGENSPYTQELIKAITTPGLEIGMVFRKVLTNVKKLS
ncbi:MAG: caspase family protein, partial [Bacteroidales bacterium]|nr:caspase family protein [Bacteroidales bacterium]